MPELPEAETIARQLRGELAGAVLGRTILTRDDIVHDTPKSLGRLIRGRRVETVSRRGKRVMIDLDPPLRLVIRLGMTGSLTVVDRTAAVEKHTHLRTAIRGSDRELRYRDPRRFGGIWVHAPRKGEPPGELSDLGLEPLEATWEQFRETMRRRRQVKALLMDQRVVAGLGNIYCDESLHAAGIHPLTAANAIGNGEAKRLYDCIRRILLRAIRRNGSTLMDYRDADGREGSFQKLHRVYQREGRPCKRCGTAIRRIVAAGRSTFFCPKCQQIC